MGLFRGLAGGAGMGLRWILLAPALALAPAALLDRGPGGSVRATLFPFALAILDPFIWDCVRNSLVMAVVVASGSLLAGGGLGYVLVRLGCWRRGPLTLLMLGPMTIPPLCGALGLRVLFRSGLEAGAGTTWGHWCGWIGWAWVGLAGGVPLVLGATATALMRVEPGWVDAARLAGAGRFRIGRQIIWPVVRPAVARALATVFTLTLVEPGVPLLLGLRRSLAFQIVEAALGPDPFPRAAVLALAALVLAVVGRMLVHWWGGRPVPVRSAAPVVRVESPTWPRAVSGSLVLVLWAVLAWLPALSMILLALDPVVDHSSGGRRLSVGVFLNRLVEPPARRLLVNSAMLGAAVVAIDLVAAGMFGGRRRGVITWSITCLEALPPLTLGVGALVLPWLLQLGSDGLRAAGGQEALTHILQALVDLLDPYRTPGVLLVMTVAAAHLPGMARAWGSGQGRSPRDRIDAALHLGATVREARRVVSSHRFGDAPSALILTLVLAATNLAPALVVAPTIESRTMISGALILAEEPGGGFQRAAALAAVALAANLIALALAARDGDGPFGAWSRSRDLSAR